MTIPANAEASIQAIKSIDTAIREGRGIPLISARDQHIKAGAVAIKR